MKKKQAKNSITSWSLVGIISQRQMTVILVIVIGVLFYVEQTMTVRENPLVMEEPPKETIVEIVDQVTLDKIDALEKEKVKRETEIETLETTIKKNKRSSFFWTWFFVIVFFSMVVIIVMLQRGKKENVRVVADNTRNDRRYLTGKINQKQQQNKRLRGQMNKLEGQNSRLEGQNSRIGQQNNTLRKQSDRNKYFANRRLNEVKQIRKKNNQIIEENSQLLATISNSDIKLNELGIKNADKIKGIQNQKKKLQQQNTEIKKRIRIALQQIEKSNLQKKHSEDKKNQRITRLNDMLKKTNNIAKELLNQKERLQNQKKQSNEKLAQYLKNNIRLERTLSKMRDNMKQLDSKIKNSNSSDNFVINIPGSGYNEQTTENKGFLGKVGTALKSFVSPLDNVDTVLETGNQGGVGYYNYTGNQGDVSYKKEY